MDNDALNFMDQFEGAVVTILEGLRSLAPAAVENGVCGGDACRWRRLGVAHDADKDVKRGPGVTARHGADFSNGFGHCMLLCCRAPDKRKYAARSPQAILSGANPTSDAGGRVRA